MFSVVLAQLYVFVTICFALVSGYIIIVIFIVLCEIIGYFVWSLSLFFVCASQITVVSLLVYIHIYIGSFGDPQDECGGSQLSRYDIYIPVIWRLQGAVA